MSLKEAIEEVEKEEKKALGVKDDPAPADDEEDKAAPAGDDEGKGADDADDAGADEGKKDDKAAADEGGKKAEGKDGKPPESENAAMARLRIEKAAAERRAAALEAQLKNAPAKPAEAAKPAANADPEPDPNTDPDAHLRWELRQAKAELKTLNEWRRSEEQKYQQKELRDNAVKAYTGYEDAFKAATPDYEEVADFGVQAIAASIRTLRPDLTGEALQEAVRTQILRTAGQDEAKGYDPVEAFYHRAKSWGYKPKAPAPAEGEEGKTEEKPKPNFKSIVESKRKSASSITPGGKNGKIPLSREAVLDKSFGLQDFARLTPEQLKEMESLEA